MINFICIIVNCTRVFSHFFLYFIFPQFYLQKRWKRFTYAEIVNFLNEHESYKEIKSLTKQVTFGTPLYRSAINYVIKKLGDQPIIITKYPPHLKAFNVVLSDKSNEVSYSRIQTEINVALMYFCIVNTVS